MTLKVSNCVVGVLVWACLLMFGAGIAGGAEGVERERLDVMSMTEVCGDPSLAGGAGDGAGSHSMLPGWLNRYDFFSNYGQYMPRIHCLQTAEGEPDWLWIGLLTLFTVTVVVGYLKIVVFWRRAYLAEHPEDRNTKLMDLAFIFSLCAVCGYVMSLLMFVWPAYRLLAMVLVFLTFVTWRFAWNLKDLEVSMGAKRLERELQQSLQKRNEELQHEVAERTHELQLINARLAMLSMVAEHTASAVIITDREGHIEWVNEAFTGITGYELKEVAGQKPGRILQGPETDPATVTLIREHLDRGEAVSTKIVNYAKDGRPYWIDIEIEPVYQDGELVRFVAIENDVTDQIRHEQALREARSMAEEASRAKSEFLANMSHEIRTPLNGITGMTELLLDTSLDDQQRHFVEVTRSSGDALLSLINDILDLSKIEANKLEIESIPFDVVDLVEDCVGMFAHRCNTKGIELICGIDARMMPTMVGDPTRIRQVLTNLLSNAIKFTEKGHVSVRTRLCQDETGQQVLELSVEDTGIGIAKEKVDQLFEAFTQADNSTTRKYGGTGLGLTITRQLVELMGGTISVESEPGVGSTFRASIPLAVSEVALSTIRREDLRGLRVLVVDDNEVNRSIFEQTLEAWGAVPSLYAGVAEAVSGVAVAKARGEVFDAAIVDMQMHPDDGVVLAERLRAEGLDEFPLILASSAEVQRDARVREAGFASVLLKPVRRSRLEAAIAEAVGRSERGDDERVSTAEVARDDDALLPRDREGVFRVIIAEDNPVNQLVSRKFVERLGLDAEVVANGVGAVRLFEQGGYDLILMDCQMPEMDGFEATTAIRQRERASGDGRRLPIIALTANAVSGDRERCLAADMDDYLSKPLNERDLREKLKRWLLPEAGQGRAEGDVMERVIDRCEAVLRDLGREGSGSSAGLEALVAAVEGSAVAELRSLTCELEGASVEAVRSVVERLIDEARSVQARSRGRADSRS
jgi:two-component system sensor histidine kinase/response regulator